MSESPSAWLTVSQAAAALGVSERTVRRRCEAGKIAAHMVTTDNGREWQIEAATVTSEAAAIGAAIYGQATDRVRPQNQSTLADVSEAAAIPSDASDNIGQAAAIGAATATVEFLRDALVHEREQNAFLRAQIEAHARSEAELRAALREALKISTRALPEATTDAKGESAPTAQSTLETPSDGAASQATTEPAQAEVLSQIETLQSNLEAQRQEILWMASQMNTPPNPQKKRGLLARWFGSD